MYKKSVISALCIVFFSAIYSQAIDRDARMIDTISLIGTSSDHTDSLGASLWGETVTSKDNEKWAILFGGALANLWQDNEESSSYWNLGIGVKYYLMTSTSIALSGLYTERDYSGKPDIKTGRVDVKHRFLPADEDISPYMLLGVGVRTVEYLHLDDDYNEFIYSIGGGIDFMMADNYAISFEATYNMTAELGDNYSSDDWLYAGVGMKYYWSWDD